MGLFADPVGKRAVANARSKTQVWGVGGMRWQPSSPLLDKCAQSLIGLAQTHFLETPRSGTTPWSLQIATSGNRSLEFGEVPRPLDGHYVEDKIEEALGW
jgi:hypothetical protein